MIPTPQELIKEALQSGPDGVLGRQAPVGSVERMAERATRKATVLSGMMERGARFRDRNPDRPKITLSTPRVTAPKMGFGSQAAGAARDLGRSISRISKKPSGKLLGGAALGLGALALYKSRKARQAAQQQGQVKVALSAEAPKMGLAAGANLATGGAAASYMHKKKKENEAALEAQYRAAQKHGPGEGQSKMAAKTGAEKREEILAKGRDRLKQFQGKMKEIDEKYKNMPTIPAKRSNTGRNVAIGLGGAALAGGLYALHKRKKAQEAQQQGQQQPGQGEGQIKMAAKTPAWTRSEGKSESGGLNRKGVASYRRENPGSKLQMAVTTKPSKLKPGSKAAKRRKSFCARMSGMPGPMKDEKGRPTRKALALRKWNC